MALIALPAVGIRSVEWTQPPRAAWSSKSIYSGRRTVIDRGTVTEGWRAKVTVAPRMFADVLAWRAWQAAMLGVVNSVRIDAVEAPQVAAATLRTIVSQTANNIVALGGLPVSIAGYMRAGMMATIYTSAGPAKPRLVTLVADLNSDGSGFGTMTFEPPIPGINGRSVMLQTPFCEMSLASGGALGWSIGPDGIYSPTDFDMEEVMP